MMTKYIANEANLKMMMNLLRDKSKNIQFEAFHVFKVGFLPLHLVEREFAILKVPPRSQVFVANPKKPPQIEIILRRNKEKLLNFLKTFHNDKEGAHCLFLLLYGRIYIYISTFIGGSRFPSLFFLVSLSSFYKLQLMTLSHVDEQFSDEKQFLIVQIQNL